MSSHSNKGGLPQSHTSTDMNLKKIMAVGVVSLLVFAVGIVWAYFLREERVREIRKAGPATAPTEIGKTEIGIVDQVPFDRDGRLDQWREARQKRLNGYGWVDRSKGLAHIPIEKAVQMVIASPPNIPGEGVPPQGKTIVTGAPVGAADSKAAGDLPDKGHVLDQAQAPNRPYDKKTGGTP